MEDDDIITDAPLEYVLGQWVPHVPTGKRLVKPFSEEWINLTQHRAKGGWSGDSQEKRTMATTVASEYIRSINKLAHAYERSRECTLEDAGKYQRELELAYRDYKQQREKLLEEKRLSIQSGRGW
jgi:hypothetical protein